MQKEVKKLCSLAEQHGFRIEHTRKGHVRFLAPNGSIVVGASTPSDSRSNKNLLSQLRRAGLQDRPLKLVPPQPVEQPVQKPAPWAHWTDEQVLHLMEQGYTDEFVLERTGR